jgi:BppU N-terminal domain
MSSITIKRYDTEGKFVDTLKVNGEPIDLTGASVKFLMKRGTTLISHPATITQTAPPPDPSAGGVEYQPVLADVSTLGKYKHEWEITFGNGKVLTVPNDSYNFIKIIRDLEGV